MTEHEFEEPFRYFSYMTIDCIIRKAAHLAISKCRNKLAETRKTLHIEWGTQSMYQGCANEIDAIAKALHDAEQSLHRVGKNYLMDQWLSEQPEWLQCAVANEVCEWVEKTFGE